MASVFILLLLSCAVPFAASTECALVDGSPCECRMSDGRGLDIRSLAKSFETKFKGSKGDFYYAWSPCDGDLDFGDQCTKATGSAGCQGSSDDKSWVSIGKTASVNYTVMSTSHPSEVIAVYTGGTDLRQMIVTLVCGLDSPGTIIETGEDPTLHYNFQVVSKDVCLKSHIGSSSSLSPGSILLIVFFVAVILYFVVGLLFMSTVRGATGTERIPNKDFWVDLPTLIKEGALFIVSPCRRQGKGYENL